MKPEYFKLSLNMTLFAAGAFILLACQPPPQPFEMSEETEEGVEAEMTAETSGDAGEDMSEAVIADMMNKAATIEVQKMETDPDGFSAFYVYSNKGSRANHYVPSGFMPNGNCVQLNDKWLDNCYSEKTCLQFNYDVECSRQDQGWAGVYWLNPANNWGSKKGGFNLEGAKKLTFWARGEKGGETVQEFLIGGINGDYPDTASATIGPVILSKDWRKYTIDLRGKDLSYISGGFAWTTNVNANAESCVFYLDDIRYE